MGPVVGGEGVEDGRTLLPSCQQLSEQKDVRKADGGGFSALSPAPSTASGIEGLSGLLFRERRGVQQGGEERAEIAGAGEITNVI